MAGPSHHPHSLPDMSCRGRDLVSPAVGAPRHGAARRSRAQCARRGMPPAVPRPRRRRSAEPRPSVVACAGDAAERVSVFRRFDVVGRMSVGPLRTASHPDAPLTLLAATIIHIVRRIACPRSIPGSSSSAAHSLPACRARKPDTPRLRARPALPSEGRAHPIARATLRELPFVKDEGSCTAGRPVMVVLAGRLPMSRARSAGPPRGFVAVLSRRPGASRPLRAALRPEPPLSQGVPASHARA